MLRDKTNYYSLFDWDSWMAFIPMRFGKEQQQTSGVTKYATKVVS